MDDSSDIEITEWSTSKSTNKNPPLAAKPYSSDPQPIRNEPPAIAFASSYSSTSRLRGEDDGGDEISADDFSTVIKETQQEVEIAAKLNTFKDRIKAVLTDIESFSRNTLAKFDSITSFEDLGKNLAIQSDVLGWASKRCLNFSNTIDSNISFSPSSDTNFSNNKPSHDSGSVPKESSYTHMNTRPHLINTQTSQLTPPNISTDVHRPETIFPSPQFPSQPLENVSTTANKSSISTTFTNKPNNVTATHSMIPPNIPTAEESDEDIVIKSSISPSKLLNEPSEHFFRDINILSDSDDEFLKGLSNPRNNSESRKENVNPQVPKSHVVGNNSNKNNHGDDDEEGPITTGRRKIILSASEDEDDSFIVDDDVVEDDDADFIDDAEFNEEDIIYSDDAFDSFTGVEFANKSKNNETKSNEDEALCIKEVRVRKVNLENEPITISDDDWEKGFTDAEEELIIYDKPETVFDAPHEPDPEENVTYPWTNEVFTKLKDIFKLKRFRTDQLKAINATLDGRDVFVLMPTGGGKSLCYQLPAIVQSGKTKGVTVVVSPLVSLMKDQVYHLKLLGVNAELVHGEMSKRDKSTVFRKFENGELALMYVSPEMLNKIIDTLRKVNNNGYLARIVIDEAHCMSSWGHDFRPDYQDLKSLKIEFPQTPIMALTATAKKHVQMDIIESFHTNDPVFIKHSFNRTNLFYEIHRKTKNAEAQEQVKNLIMTKFAGKTGIIYCNTKKSCEDLSSFLWTNGLRVGYYHAGMLDKDKENMQRQWQEGKIQAICATIAFGMGIDKPDVRFVIHFHLPRTLEGYYQESGRAGRDGKESHCILFYSYADFRNLQGQIARDDSLAPTMKDHYRRLLNQVNSYCDNVTDCRRSLVLSYFDENFNRRGCNNMCDNCKNYQSVVKQSRDYTGVAQDLTQLVGSVHSSNGHLTPAQTIDAYMGRKIKSSNSLANVSNSPFFGKGKGRIRACDLERVITHLLSSDILRIYTRKLNHAQAFANDYLQQGREATRLLNGNSKIELLEVLPTSGSTTPRPSSSNSRRSSTRAQVTIETTVSTSTSTAISRSVPTPRPITSRSSTTGQTLASAFSFNPSRPVSNLSKNTTTSLTDVESHRYCQLEIVRLQLKTKLNLSNVEEVCTSENLKKLARELPTDIESFSRAAGVSQDSLTKIYPDFAVLIFKLKSEQSSASAAAQPAISTTTSFAFPSNDVDSDSEHQSRFFGSTSTRTTSRKQTTTGRVYKPRAARGRSESKSSSSRSTASRSTSRTKSTTSKRGKSTSSFSSVPSMPF